MHTFLLLLVTIVWGSTFFIIKDTVSNVNEYFIVFGRSLIAAVVMLIYTFFKEKKSLIDKKAIIRGSILGLLLALTYIPQTIGLKYTSSGHSAFITGSAVILVPILLYFYFRTKMIKSDIISVSIVFIGLFLLTYDFNTKINIGDIITLITAAAYANHLIISGKYASKGSLLSIITYQFVIATLISFVGYLITKDGELVLSNKSIYAISYLGIFGTLFCYFVIVWIQKYVSSIKVALIFSLEPVFAAIFGYYILHEILDVKEIIGALLIMVGVVLYQYLRRE